MNAMPIRSTMNRAKSPKPDFATNVLKAAADSVTMIIASPFREWRDFNDLLMA